ncbi:hypothetical protein COY30_01550 [Candidatus Woesebacteria bacterium CG_4_10_14_0_2_um_filter_44_9]|uniref:LytR/CpsA/Psr regulator C-terminal domain-containing protein n=2 Tax=Candidatus Woeseibacteriota TaxID=1752722 RepID=A0A2H0BHZ5_9BACT|nr:MAG: hypothetical protein COX04_00290 [Candidatus Woesebacteria bacterium CG22_combo_CG10-13_8_21_14_all_45_10]PIZ45662.1 MAG: hypothetical protein COY30_01550 [Candidatus Woesebacteria bacterium CG_4_10_14_0_2_um_filter_44_9]
MEKPEKQAPKMVVEEVASTEPPEPAPEAAAEVKTEIPKENPVTKFNILWIFVPGILLLGLLVGGIFAYYHGINKINSPTPTPVSGVTVASPTPTSPAKQTDLTKYSIAVLNGSGIAGEAGKVKTILQEAGFKVASTANAKTYDYDKTEISTKEGIEADFIKALVFSLSKTYQLADPLTSATQSASIVVTVGSLKAK